MEQPGRCRGSVRPADWSRRHNPCRPPPRGHDLRPEGEQRLEVRAVAGLATGQVKAQRIAVPVGFEVDLGREAPAGAAETWGRTMVESNICTK